MDRKPGELSHDDWIEYVFGREVPFYGVAWYHQADADWWSPTPQQAIQYLTRLFQAPDRLAGQFTDGQIGQGLYYLVDNGAGGYCRFLTDDAVPLDLRVACISAMATLFARLFHPRCVPVLSHKDEAAGNQLNGICYMWWDVAPIGAAATPARTDPIHEACLSVMKECLKLANPACQESALHGLGHWAHAYPEFAQCAIDAYLSSNPSLRPELQAYALAARSGCVQ